MNDIVTRVEVSVPRTLPSIILRDGWRWAKHWEGWCAEGPYDDSGNTRACVYISMRGNVEIVGVVPVDVVLAVIRANDPSMLSTCRACGGCGVTTLSEQAATAERTPRPVPEGEWPKFYYPAVHGNSHVLHLDAVELHLTAEAARVEAVAHRNAVALDAFPDLAARIEALEAENARLEEENFAVRDYAHANEADADTFRAAQSAPSGLDETALRESINRDYGWEQCFTDDDETREFWRRGGARAEATIMGGRLFLTVADVDGDSVEMDVDVPLPVAAKLLGLDAAATRELRAERDDARRGCARWQAWHAKKHSAAFPDESEQPGDELSRIAALASWGDAESDRLFPRCPAAVKGGTTDGE